MSGFRTFAAPHLVAMALTVLLPVALAWIARRRDARTARAIALGWALMMLANELVYWTIRVGEVGLGGFLRYHLPLNLCGAAVLLTIATLIRPNQRLYEIVYFWGLVGAGNAVLTPGNLDVGFPEYRFFQYFIAHSGIFGGVVFATWGLGMRPDLKGFVRSIVYLNLLAVVAAVANVLLGTNYLFLSSPPPGTVSPFFFLPWPWYLVFLEFLGVGMFFLALLPFLRKRSGARPARS